MRARSTAPRMRAATSTYGSPQDGRSGLMRYFQLRGSRNAPSPGDTFLPSKMFSDSMRSASVAMLSPCRSAMGEAVCWARSRGEAMMATMSLSASASATDLAWAWPRSER